jgi:hypothetical protein
MTDDHRHPPDGPPPHDGPPPDDGRHGTDDPRWLDDPRHVTLVVRGLGTLCVLALVADLFYDKHPKFGFEGWPAFYAVYGFVGSVGLVLTAKWLRRWLMRPEDYYEPLDRGPDDE